MKGFTAVEILVVLAIFALLLTISVVAIGALRGDSDLEAEAKAFQRTLELARSKTIASEGDARYGAYVDTSVNPHQYVLFQGNTYASRVVNKDEVYKLRNTIEFSSVSFGGGPEVVFDRIQGTTSQTGSAVLQIKADPANTTTVSVESSGNVEIDDSPDSIDDCVSVGGNRICDSRHVRIDYVGRVINTATEEILLDFESNGTTDATIVIQNNLSGGQIVWEGTVTVDTEDQKIKIHTHTLNSGAGSNETQFSVHRDRRFNTKALTIRVPGTVADPDSGTLIVYGATGITTQGTSAYASAPIPQ